MLKGRGWLCLCFSALLLTAASLTVYANLKGSDNQQTAIEILEVSGTFRYASPIGNEYGLRRDYDSIAPFFYTDKYFHNSSFAVWDAEAQRWAYNDSLATMSLALAMAAHASNEGGTDFSNKSKNAEQLLTDIGFTEFEANEDFNRLPEKDTIGAVAAQRQITVGENNYTLIALAIRGEGYGAEWASNFTVGIDGHHQGFEEASASVLTFLREYISRNNITGDIKLWLTGFSRAAATANLSAAALVDGAYLGSYVILEPENLFAFCFATPRGALYSQIEDSSRYNNIINIISPYDIVTEVAPGDAPFGFVRYGVDVLLPTVDNSSDYAELRADMLKHFDMLEATDGCVVDDFRMKTLSVELQLGALPSIEVVESNSNWSQGHFIRYFIRMLAVEQFKDRENYVDNFQEDLREVLAVIFGSDDVQWVRFTSNFRERITCSDNIARLIVAAVFPYGSRFFGSVEKQMENHLISSLNEAGISTYDRELISNLAGSLSRLLIDFSIGHPDLAATLSGNLDSILAAHYPEYYLAWMKSRDSNF